MADFSGRIDVDKLVSYSDDLVAVLKGNRDINNMTHCLEKTKAFQSSCEAEFADARLLLEDYQKKIDECMQKTEKAKAEVPADAEMDLLQKELEAELEKERLLMGELRFIGNEINDLERQKASLEEQKQTLKKLEQDELKALRKLSMYASVTNIIPNLDDHGKISGYIVDRDRKVVENFEFNPTKMTAFDTCQSIWKMIDLQ